MTAVAYRVNDMYQVNFEHDDASAFGEDLRSLRARVEAGPHSKVLFHVYASKTDSAVMAPAIDEICRMFPEALYVGGTTGGNIVDGRLVQSEDASVSIVCSIFEDPGTLIEILSLPFSGDCQDDTAARIVEAVRGRPWVKAVEIISAISDAKLSDFCHDISDLPEGIAVFGGGVLSTEGFDPNAAPPYVVSSAGEANPRSVVFILYGGDNFHVATRAISGWKPLGMPMRITRAEGPILFELDGKPAYDVYHRYLKIKPGPDFFVNSLLFPLAIDHGGKNLLRASIFPGEDGSLMLTTDLAAREHTCRIAYGDPATILQSIADTAQTLRDFDPQGVLVYTCASRLLYWGPDYIDRETEPFSALAPTAGFFTSSECMRDDGEVLNHNVALVVAAVREGEPDGPNCAPIEVDDREFNRQMQIVNYLATFIGAASEELEAAYTRMELLAKTDGLTRLCDRRETERLVGEAVAQSADPVAAADGDAALEELYGTTPSVVMLDIDNFKKVNDTYGHEEGDCVLRGLAKMLLGLEENMVTDGVSGRWGGEEFMVLLAHEDLDAAAAYAERIRTGFAALEFEESGSHTVSVGVAQMRPGETADELCERVDAALYRAKAAGKNCVVVDP